MGVNYGKTPTNYYEEDYENYRRLMLKTNALYHNNNPKRSNHKSSRSDKWNKLLKYIWRDWEEYEGKGVVVIPSDPNALLKRLDLLHGSKKAGHTGVRNELLGICDELNRQGVLNSESYKKLISSIINDSPLTRI